MTLGGKTRRSPAARLLFEPSQALGVKTPTPLADDLARCVEPGGDRVIGHSFARQQHDLGSNNIAVTRRERATNSARSALLSLMSKGSASA
jgi:hypothetical protein